MAIDPRISLSPAPTINVGQRFGQTLSNLQNIDLLNQRRDIAPLQLEQAQRANELGIAQQPAQLQAAEFAASGQTQALLNAEQEAQLDQFNAQSLNTALASGSPATVTEALNQQLQRATKFNLPNDIAEAQQALQMVNQEGGLQTLQQATTAALSLTSNKGKSLSQKEFDANVEAVKADPKGLTTEGKAAAIKLRLIPGATGSAAQTIAATGVTEVVAGSEAIIEGAKEKAKQVAGNIGKAVGKGLDAGVKAFEKIPSVKTAIANYDDAIAQLDAGAETGIIDSMLPSFTAAGKNLDNTIKRLGLDVVGNTTFGALSESELAFALKAAIPDNLQPAELRKWLVAKKNAQQKLLTGLDEMANFLGDGTKTLVDWSNRQAVNTLAPSTSSQITGNVDLKSLSLDELKALAGNQ